MLNFSTDQWVILALVFVLGIAMGIVIANGVAFYAGWTTIVTAWSMT